MKPSISIRTAFLQSTTSATACAALVGIAGDSAFHVAIASASFQREVLSEFISVGLPPVPVRPLA